MMTNAERARELVEAWWRDTPCGTDIAILGAQDREALAMRIASALDAVRRETVEECARLLEEKRNRLNQCAEEARKDHDKDEWFELGRKAQVLHGGGPHEEGRDMTEIQNRGAALLVREWYDVCGNGPLDTKVLKRILQAELSARDDYEARLVQRRDELQVIADTRLLAMQEAETRATALRGALQALIRNHPGDWLDADYRDACAALAETGEVDK